MKFGKNKTSVKHVPGRRSDWPARWLLGTPVIKSEIDEYDPCALLFPLGYLPIWTSIGGNAIVYGLDEDEFYWADHTGWIRGDCVMLPGTNNELPFTNENIDRDIAVWVEMPVGKEWFDRVKGMSLFEMQLDSMDWLLNQKPLPRVPEAQWKKQLTKYQEMRDVFASKKVARDEEFDPVID